MTRWWTQKRTVGQVCPHRMFRYWRNSVCRGSTNDGNFNRSMFTAYFFFIITFIFTTFQHISPGLLQVFVELGSLLRTSNYVFHFIHVGSRVWLTSEEGRRIYWSKHCEYNSKDEDNCPKILIDKNQQALSQKSRQLTKAMSLSSSHIAWDLHTWLQKPLGGLYQVSRGESEVWKR